jgi:hypothetical protein
MKQYLVSVLWLFFAIGFGLLVFMPSSELQAILNGILFVLFLVLFIASLFGGKTSNPG